MLTRRATVSSDPDMLTGRRIRSGNWSASRNVGGDPCAVVTARYTYEPVAARAEEARGEGTEAAGES
eukprot:763474-Hanusia_phi.AAC.7